MLLRSIGQDIAVIFYPPYEVRILVTGGMVMLFNQLPTGVLALVLAISCAVKHTALRRFAYSSWYRSNMQQRHWLLGLSLLSTSSGVLTYCIFDRVASWELSGLVVSLDVFILAVFGAYTKHVNLLEQTPSEAARDVWCMRTALAVMYCVFIWFALEHR